MRRNVLITGAASGIGRHLVAALAERGNWVLATDVDEFGLEEAASRDEWDVLGVETRLLDVTQADEWRHVVESVVTERGHLDLLLHAAGYIHPGFAHETDVDELERQVDINLKGTMLGTRIVGEVMVDQETGHIVHFGSMASLAPVPGLSGYTGSKFGVRGFSLAAAEELRDLGVAVSVVLPDAVETPMFEKQIDFDEAALSFSTSEPLTVEHIEEVVLGYVLPERPLEVTIPRSRGLLAKLTNLLPELGQFLGPLLEKIGRANQELYRD